MSLAKPAGARCLLVAKYTESARIGNAREKMKPSGARDAASTVAMRVNGRPVFAPAGASAAAAMLLAGVVCRVSLRGEPRGPLCGMGICMECRATVDGVPHTRTCQMTVREGMEIVTG